LTDHRGQEHFDIEWKQIRKGAFLSVAATFFFIFFLLPEGLQDFVVEQLVPMGVGGVILGFDELYNANKGMISAPIVVFVVIVAGMTFYFNPKLRAWVLGSHVVDDKEQGGRPAPAVLPMMSTEKMFGKMDEEERTITLDPAPLRRIRKPKSPADEGGDNGKAASGEKDVAGVEQAQASSTAISEEQVIPVIMDLMPPRRIRQPRPDSLGSISTGDDQAIAGTRRASAEAGSSSGGGVGVRGETGSGANSPLPPSPSSEESATRSSRRTSSPDWKGMSSPRHNLRVITRAPTSEPPPKPTPEEIAAIKKASP